MTGSTDTRDLGRAGAGPQGDDVRSDLHVEFERRPSGDLEIEIRSRVALYYGAAIERQAREVLAAMGVTHGRLLIDDQGGLPFVIAARIEAAVRRTGFGGEHRAVPAARPLPPHSERDRVRRSRLYLPGNEPKYMVNAGLHHPDAVILDLEDSVHPDEKDAARLLVRNALLTLDFGRAERMVRINQLPLGLKDLEEIVPAAPDLLLLPKVEHADDVAEVDGICRDLAARHGLERPVWLMPILETAKGIEHAFGVARASSHVVAITLGLEDYTADLGVVKTATGEESLYARMRTVNAARAAGVQAIDSVYGNIDDLDGLRAWGLRSRAMGFEGMGCVHPRQIPVIHEAYAPTAQEIEKALAIEAAFRDAEARGLGVVSLGSKMIDPPVVNRARKLVARARAMGLVKEGGEA